MRGGTMKQLVKVSQAQYITLEVRLGYVSKTDEI